MRIIGLCGGSGSGKGAVAAFFNAYGIPSIDTDAVYHEITSSASPCLRELAARFGDGIIKDGALDRAALRAIVFTDEDFERKHRDLCSITHRHVLMRTREILSEYDKMGKSAVIVDAPMLFESGFDSECDEIVCVISDENLRIARIMLRDGIGFEDARRRIASQKSDEFLKAHSDHVIINDGDLSDLEAEAHRVAEKILKNKN